MLIFFFVGGQVFKHAKAVPGYFQCALEFAVEFLDGITEGAMGAKGKGFRKISRVVFNYQSSFFEDFTKARDSLYIDTAWTQKIKKIFSKK